MRYPVLDRLLGINTILFILPNKYISLKSKFNTPSQLWERALEKNHLVPTLGSLKIEKKESSQLWEDANEKK